MKNMMRWVVAAIVVSAATVACGATDGTEGKTEDPAGSTEQATSSCYPFGHSCVADGLRGQCCTTNCPAGQLSVCRESQRDSTCACSVE